VKKRKKLGEEMLARNIKATRLRKEMASDIMDFGDVIPAHLPSNEVGRRIRAEAIQCKRVDNDPLKALQLLKYSTNPLYMYSIQDIGLDPFFIHICTPDQIKLYNLYCEKHYARLIIDATGKRCIR